MTGSGVTELFLTRGQENLNLGQGFLQNRFLKIPGNNYLCRALKALTEPQTYMHSLHGRRKSVSHVSRHQSAPGTFTQPELLTLRETLWNLSPPPQLSWDLLL